MEITENNAYHKESRVRDATSCWNDLTATAINWLLGNDGI